MTNHSPVVTLRLSPETASALHDIAHQQNRPRSQLVRNALAYYLSEPDGHLTPDDDATYPVHIAFRADHNLITLLEQHATAHHVPLSTVLRRAITKWIHSSTVAAGA